MSITIATSNVNGLRAAARKDVGAWVSSQLPDVWCMQEVRAPQSAIDPILE
ncbi:MAG: endonuclease/exonuclease/phosphatase family protein, partial [Bifidobacterium sp.]